MIADTIEKYNIGTPTTLSSSSKNVMVARSWKCACVAALRIGGKLPAKKTSDLKQKILNLDVTPKSQSVTDTPSSLL